MEKKPITAINQDLDIGLLLMMFRKNIWYIFLLFSIISLSVFFYLRYTHPIFESESMIQLTEQENDYLKSGAGDNPFKQNLASEIELLRSPVFLQYVVDVMPLQITFFSRGAVLKTDNYNRAPYSVELIEVLDPEVFGRKIAVSFEAESYGLAFDVNEDRLFYRADYGDVLNTPYFSLILNLSEGANYARFADEFYFEINNPAVLVSKYLKNLSITVQNEAARTISIAHTDVNPYRASDIVNAVAREFEYFTLKNRNESANQVLLYIDATLEIVQEALAKSDSALNDFKRRHGLDIIVDETGKAKFVEKEIANIQKLQDERYKFIFQLRMAQRLFEKTKDWRYNEIEVGILLDNLQYSGALGRMLNRIESLTSQKSILAYRVKEQGLEYKEIDYRIALERKLFHQGVGMLIEVIELRIRELEDEIKLMAALMTEKKEDEVKKGVPANEAEYYRLKRIFEINERYYNDLIDKRQHYELARAGYTPGFRVLKISKPNLVPIAPNKNLIILGGLGLWLFLSFVLVATKYLFFDQILTLADIAKYTHAPILGAVGQMKNEIPISQLVVDKNPKSSVSEVFRAIRSNMEFLSANPGSKIVSVTSTISGEGKTFITLNIAGILALAGKRVIVIDGDMRKPKIHHGFNATNDIGLSTLLIGKTSLEEVTRLSEVENLHFITAGPIPPNPSELLLSDNMNNLLLGLKEQYDYVVVDNPPVGIVTDGISVLRQADYPIYVFRSGYSRKIFIQNLERLIVDNKINKFSVMLNAVSANVASKYSYNAYVYGYGYGYGGYGSYGGGYGTAGGYGGYGGYGYGYYEDSDSQQEKGRGILGRLLRLFFRR
jgi:tyrosine-protein kinase Etk/Wzc